MREEIYKAKKKVENPLLDSMSKEAIIAWFRCNSCLTCAFREEVVDNHPTLTTKGCSRMHDKPFMVEMVEFLGYIKE